MGTQRSPGAEGHPGRPARPLSTPALVSSALKPSEADKKRSRTKHHSGRPAEAANSTGVKRRCEIHKTR